MYIYRFYIIIDRDIENHQFSHFEVRLDGLKVMFVGSGSRLKI